MATRQGSLLPAIKIPGSIDDRAVLSALESIKDHLESAAARSTLHFQKLPFTQDIHAGLVETTVYNPQTVVELTDASFVPNVNSATNVTMLLWKRDANGEAQTLIAMIDGRVSGATSWSALKPKTFIISGPRKLLAGQHHSFQVLFNSGAAALSGTLALAYREVL